jgi:hypothetical protein
LIFERRKNMSTAGSVIVAFDHKDGDKAILLVGKKNPKQDVAIINAFQGEEAIELWKKLTTKEEK